MTIRTIAALAMALLFTTATQANELNLFQKMELRSACGPDIEAACGSVQTGEGRLAQCIRDNAEKLSQPCRDTISRIKADFLVGTDAAMDF
jgi:hypothetical protein